MTFSCSSGIVSAGVRGRWHFKDTVQRLLLESHLHPHQEGLGLDGTHWAEGTNGKTRAGLNELVFREVSFEGKEPKRISQTARHLPSPMMPLSPLAEGGPRSCLTHIEGDQHAYPLTWHQSPSSCIFLNMAKASSSRPSGSRTLTWREATGVG